MGHTPGPWKVVDRLYVWTDDDVGCEVAKVCDENLDDDMVVQADADARLIAAAPELLSQLKMASEFISGHNKCLSVPSGSGDRKWNDYCVGLLEDCEAAIAKAEGRSE